MVDGWQAGREGGREGGGLVSVRSGGARKADCVLPGQLIRHQHLLLEAFTLAFSCLPITGFKRGDKHCQNYDLPCLLQKSTHSHRCLISTPCSDIHRLYTWSVTSIATARRCKNQWAIKRHLFHLKTSHPRAHHCRKRPSLPRLPQALHLQIIKNLKLFPTSMLLRFNKRVPL